MGKVGVADVAEDKASYGVWVVVRETAGALSA